MFTMVADGIWYGDATTTKKTSTTTKKAPDAEQEFLANVKKKTSTASKKTVETKKVVEARQNPVMWTSGYGDAIFQPLTPEQEAVLWLAQNEVRNNITSSRQYANDHDGNPTEGQRLYAQAIAIIDRGLETGQLIQRGDKVYTHEGEYLTNLALVATMGSGVIQGANQYLGYQLGKMQGIAVNTFNASALQSGKNPPGTNAYEYRPTLELQTYYPPNHGFLDKPTSGTLQPGTRIDRYGYNTGTYASPAGTPLHQRALPYGSEAKPYNVYEVVEPVVVETGVAGPWFGSPGGGTQYHFANPIADLIEKGVLKVIG